MSTFSVQLDQFVKKTGADADKVVRQSCLSLLNSVVRRSPVHTGRFRGNWQTTVAMPATGVVAADDKSGGATVDKGLRVIGGVKAGQTVWIMNNLPYARRLEDGYSDQAPNGMVRLTVNDFRKYVDQAIARVNQ